MSDAPWITILDHHLGVLIIAATVVAVTRMLINRPGRRR